MRPNESFVLVVEFSSYVDQGSVFNPAAFQHLFEEPEDRRVKERTLRYKASDF